MDRFPFRRWVAAFLVVALLGVLPVILGRAAPAVGVTTRVSLASDGAEGYSASDNPSISADGRYVAFISFADNLVPDLVGGPHTFVHDRLTGETTLVSAAGDGTPANGWSIEAALSADGRYIAFSTDASNLVPGDTNNFWDIYVHDRELGTTKRVSVSSSGAGGSFASQDPAISADGRFVAFESLSNNLVDGDADLCGYYSYFYSCSDVFVHDQQTGETTRVSVASDGTQGNGGSFAPSLSADGRYVAFYSYASNLVEGDTNTCADDQFVRNCADVFVHDRQTGETTRVSTAGDGAQGNYDSLFASISADGRFVAFASQASTLVDEDPLVCSGLGAPGCQDIFVHDRQTGETRLVSVSSGGSQSNGWSGRVSISGDGRFVAFSSEASNLVPGDTNVCDYYENCPDVFIHDLQTGETTRASVSSYGLQANGYSSVPSLSFDGRYIAFDSDASNLVAGDTNYTSDVFVRDRLAEFDANFQYFPQISNGPTPTPLPPYPW